MPRESARRREAVAGWVQVMPWTLGPGVVYMLDPEDAVEFVWCHQASRAKHITSRVKHSGEIVLHRQDLTVWVRERKPNV